MSQATINAALASVFGKLGNIALNTELQAVVPVLDTFLTKLQANAGNKPAQVAEINAVGPELLAAVIEAAPSAEAQGIGLAKTELDAAAAKAETQTSGS